MAVSIFYDGDCPFCARYVRFLKLQETAGPVGLIDVRTDNCSREELQQQGFNLDEGMVVELDGQRLGGADAVNTLALLSTPVGLFNRLNRLLLSSVLLSRVLYPALRAGRWLTLFLLNREGFAPKDEGISAKGQIFSQFFALFSLFHFFNYALEYGRFPPGYDQIALFLSALALLFRPRSARLLWLLMLTSTISTFIQAPVQSNHTMMRSALLLGYWLAFTVTWLQGSNWQDIFRRFVPVGQGALLVMYFFGIFHKLNTDFLNPVTSCAVALWQHMPIPLSLLQGAAIDYTTIYGTFVAEGILIAMLLTRRLRYLGICGGILFHMLLAMSNYAMYITFTVLTIAMHSLFIDRGAAENMVRSKEMTVIRSRLKDPVYILALCILMVLLALAALRGAYSTVTLLMLPVVLPFCWVVFRYGRAPEAQIKTPALSANKTVGLVTSLLLVANCMMPYLGLKTSQAINMFANLRLEAGTSNHLIMPAPGPYDYLEKVAIIEDGGQDSVLQSYAENGYAIIYYDLLARLEEDPDNQVTFTIDDRQFEDVSSQDLNAEIASTLHPRWFRKFFHFQPVVLTEPEHCNV
ncbi:MAG: DUF393 domain-containing protein [Gammaproteobacteria bacterium]|nr:DUF393 domain-containing protein [Gammaproteobacteria bacterium]